MKNRRLILPLIAMSLGLAACQDGSTETETPTEETSNEDGSTTDSVTSGVKEDEQIPTEGEPSDPDYALLDQAKNEYYSGELDAAAGTLSRLLQKDLSEKELLKAEAEDLKEEISQQQADSAKETAENQESSAYIEERQSALLNEEYEAATGQSLSEATDEELKAWLAEREDYTNEPAGNEEATDGTETNEESTMTKEEAENYAFEQVRERAEIEGENYFYFVSYTEDNWVQIEARESVEQDGVTFSNLMGIYRYNVETDEMQKLDVIAGEYSSVEE